MKNRLYVIMGTLLLFMLPRHVEAQTLPPTTDGWMVVSPDTACPAPSEIDFSEGIQPNYYGCYKIDLSKSEAECGSMCNIQPGTSYYTGTAAYKICGTPGLSLTVAYRADYSIKTVIGYAKVGYFSGSQWDKESTDPNDAAALYYFENYPACANPVVGYVEGYEVRPTLFTTNTEVFLSGVLHPQRDNTKCPWASVSGDVSFVWCPMATSVTTQTAQAQYCPDGTEVISDTVYLEAGEFWTSDAISTTWNYLQARYTISNANETAGRTLAGLATLNGSDWLWGPESNGTIVSVTIPSSIGYDEEPNGPVVELGVRNTYDPFYLVSACIVPYSQTMVPSDCNLVNHSFTEDLPGWSTLAYDYLSDEEDGAISLGSITGLASQVVTLTGSFKMEVRARSSGSASSFRFGGYELGYPFESEAFTETATSEYQIFSGYLYLNGDSNISIVSNDDDLIVDWVCLSGHDTGGLPWKFPIPDCTFPSYDDHPDFSITQIGNWIAWLAEKFGELLKWLVCEFYRVLFTIANAIIDAIRAIGGFVGSPDWPTLPDEITFDSILEWFRQCFVAFFNWLGLNFSRFRDAIPVVAEWLWNVLAGMGLWMIERLIIPFVVWIIERIFDLLGIGGDVRTTLTSIFYDVITFMASLWLEIKYEFDSLVLLLTETTSVFGVLITGVIGVGTGESELDFGESLGGLAGYLWRGVAFINDVVTFTPISALNIVALGILTIGLAQWTIRKFVSTLERLFS